MTYRQALSYLDSFINYEKKDRIGYQRSFKLQRMRFLLSRIGDPQDRLRCIHIAGTKGKGSTAVFTAYMLRQAGYRVGLYTSPHLCDLRERIRVLQPSGMPGGAYEGMVSKKQLAVLVADLQPRINAVNRQARFGRLTFFEVYTALAFEHFLRLQVDFAVLETGLGGRLDATNTARPLICAITPISYDHQDVLGPTLAAIAGEKAGIVKPASLTSDRTPLTVVSAGQRPSAMRILRRRCRRQKARLSVIGSDCVVRDVRCNRRGGVFSLRTPWGSFSGLRIGLSGEHQIGNAALAVSLVAALRAFGRIKADDAALAAGLKAAQWPGRLESILPRGGSVPAVLLDGAHNRASAAALALALRRLYPRRRKTLILGISKDKDACAICRALVPCGHNSIATQAQHPRALPAHDLCAIVRRLKSKSGKGGAGGGIVASAPSFAGAYQKAVSLCRRQDLIVVCGSLFLVGEAKQFFNETLS